MNIKYHNNLHRTEKIQELNLALPCKAGSVLYGLRMGPINLGGILPVKLCNTKISYIRTSNCGMLTS